jgi:hypothetical protein
MRGGWSRGDFWQGHAALSHHRPCAGTRFAVLLDVAEPPGVTIDHPDDPLGGPLLQRDGVARLHEFCELRDGPVHGGEN